MKNLLFQLIFIQIGLTLNQRLSASSPKNEEDWPVSAVKLVDDPAGGSPASARFPVGAVVISGDGAGDQTIGSPEVNVLVGWV